jgi:hypothetical protein
LTRLALGGLAEVNLRRSLFWDRLDSLEADALIIVSPISLLAGFDLGRGTFLYEQAKASLVFLHYAFLHYKDCLGTHLSRQRELRQRELRQRGDYGALAQRIGAALAGLAAPGGRPT